MIEYWMENYYVFIGCGYWDLKKSGMREKKKVVKKRKNLGSKMNL